MRFVNLTGIKFGRLTALRRTEDRGHNAQWVWLCDCGNEVVAMSCHVKSGHTSSCGCIWTERCVKHRHGHNEHGKQTRTYKAWVNMRSRVDPEIEQYRANYADRGITVCDRWKADFVAFIADMGECPQGMSLDRIDNDGNYEPGNCRWATPAQQSSNTRRTVLVDFGGETVCLADACRKAGIHPATAQHRMSTGMTSQEALSVPVRKKNRKTQSVASMVLNQSTAWMLY